MPSAVAFDLDGTLVDSLADIAHACNHAFEVLGLPTHPLDAYRGFVGEGVGRLLEQALPPERMDLRGEAETAFRARYGEHLLDLTQPYPGVVDLLRALTERGVPLGVLSNKPHPMTARVVEALFGDLPWKAVEGVRPERPRKPNPAGAFDVAEALGVDPSQVLFVGDTKVDVGTARAAGMVPVGVLWGFRPRAELEAAGAAHLLDAPADLLPLLG
jgi:phosphoglycolate phosphatase